MAKVFDLSGRGLLGRYFAEPLFKKIQRARPGSCVRFRSITLPAAAVKTMRRVGIVEKLVRFAELSQLGLKPAHFVRRWIFVELAKVALNRAGDVGRKGRRRGGKEGDAPAHAKSDNAQPGRIGIGAAFEKIDRGVDIV